MGCGRLEAATYSDTRVAEVLNNDFVPIQRSVGETLELQDRYGVAWTPTLLILDPEGKMYYRFEGFLPPEEFLVMLGIGRAMIPFRQRKHAEARPIFEEVLESFPESLFRPEALYYAAAARLYSGDRDGAVAIWDEIREKHRDTLWAVRLPR